MRTHPSPTEPEHTHEEIHDDLFDADSDGSSGYIVFALGPTFDEATFDA